jgi:hypothetical protein
MLLSHNKVLKVLSLRMKTDSQGILILKGFQNLSHNKGVAHILMSLNKVELRES